MKLGKTRKTLIKIKRGFTRVVNHTINKARHEGRMPRTKHMVVANSKGMDKVLIRASHLLVHADD